MFRPTDRQLIEREILWSALIIPIDLDRFVMEWRRSIMREVILQTVKWINRSNWLDFREMDSFTWMGLYSIDFDFLRMTYRYTAFFESDNLNVHSREQIRSQMRSSDTFVFDSRRLRMRSSRYSS